MKRVMFVVTVERTIMAFLLPYACAMRSRGWLTTSAVGAGARLGALDSYFDEVIELSWSRSPWRIDLLLRSYFGMLRHLQSQKYDIIFVHTPIAAFITRLAIITNRMLTNHRASVHYVAHGFHFHARSGFIKGSMFKLAERLVKGATDVLYVMNREDLEAASAYDLGKKIVKIDGIGLPGRFFSRAPVGDRPTRQEPHVLVVAEFIKRKRHSDILKAIARCPIQLTVTFAGTGPLEADVKAEAVKLGILDRCVFSGFREDIDSLLKDTDCLLLASDQEGLPRSILEAMAAGVPVVASDCRGSADLLEGDCGFQFRVGSPDSLVTALRNCFENVDERRRRVKNAYSKVSSSYREEKIVELVLKEMESSEERQIALLVAGLGASLVRFRFELIQELQRNNYIVFAAVAGCDAKSLEILNRASVRVSQFPTKRAGVSIGSDIWFTLRIAGIIRRLNPTVVIPYTHKPVIYTAFAKFVSMRRPVLCPIISGLGLLRNESPSLEKTAAQFLYQVAFRAMDGVIFQNQDDAAIFSARLRSKQIKSRVVAGSGVDLNEFVFAEQTGGPFTVLFVGRLIREKGIDVFVRAANRLAKEFKDIRFIAAGARYQSSAGLSEQEIQMMSESSAVQFVGEVELVQGYLTASHVFCLPSFYGEGVPRTSLEALAVGRPIVTTDWPGCREVVRGPFQPLSPEVTLGQNGLLVQPKNAEALFDAIKYLYERRESLRAMGLESRRYAEERFDVKKVVRDCVEFVESLRASRTFK